MTVPAYSRLALIGVLAATLALAACGRKGPLDLPPSSSADATQQAGATQQAAAPRSNDPRRPQGPNRHLLIDGLLD
jgi:predicted small lipoprotein YifL